MKKQLLLLFALFVTAVANAQSLSWGITGKAGVFTTMESAGEEIKDTYFTGALGLQAGLGFWVSQPITPSGRLQFTLLHTVERQNSGKIPLVDDIGDYVIDVKVMDHNMAVGSSAVYLYQLNQSLALGTGIGGIYEYFSQAKVSFKSNPHWGSAFKENFENQYRRKIRLYLPVDVQYQLSDQIALVGQVQVPLSNRIAASETSFKERDFGFWVGINYGF